MWLLAVFGFLAVIVAVMVIALHVQAKSARDGADSGTPRIVYTMRKTPDRSGPSMSERWKGGQRPFGETAATRRR